MARLWGKAVLVKGLMLLILSDIAKNVLPNRTDILILVRKGEKCRRRQQRGEDPF